MQGYKPPTAGQGTNWRARKCKNLAALSTDSQLAFPRMECIDLTSKGAGTRNDDMIHAILDEGIGQLVFDKRARLIITTMEGGDRFVEIQKYLGLDGDLVNPHQFQLILKAVQEACILYQIPTAAEDLHALAKQNNFVQDKPWELENQKKEEAAEDARRERVLLEREEAVRRRGQGLSDVPSTGSNQPTPAPSKTPPPPPPVPAMIAQGQPPAQQMGIPLAQTKSAPPPTNTGTPPPSTGRPMIPTGILQQAIDFHHTSTGSTHIGMSDHIMWKELSKYLVAQAIPLPTEQQPTSGHWQCTLCGNNQDHSLCQGCGQQARPELIYTLPQHVDPELLSRLKNLETTQKPFQPTPTGGSELPPGSTTEKRPRTKSNEQQFQTLKDKHDDARKAGDREDHDQPPTAPPAGIDDIISTYQEQADERANHDPVDTGDDTRALGQPPSNPTQLPLQLTSGSQNTTPNTQGPPPAEQPGASPPTGSLRTDKELYPAEVDALNRRQNEPGVTTRSQLDLHSDIESTERSDSEYRKSAKKKPTRRL